MVLLLGKRVQDWERIALVIPEMMKLLLIIQFKIIAFKIPHVECHV